MTSENEITNLSKQIMQGRQITPEFITAFSALENGQIPPAAIKKHPGPGGRPIKYISHIWVTQQLRLVLGPLWSFDVLDTNVYSDNSATAVVRLTVKVPLETGEYLESTITEVGAFGGGGKEKGMTIANIVAAAASRGLCRCVMRRFGLGAELYEDEIPVTFSDALSSLLAYGEKRGLEEQEIRAAIKGAGIGKDTLVEEYILAFDAVGKAVAAKKAGATPAEI